MYELIYDLKYSVSNNKHDFYLKKKKKFPTLSF